MDELAEAYKAAGRLPEAIGIYEHVVEVMQRKYPHRDLQLMVALDGLAAAYHNAGRFEEAIRQREKIQVALEKKYGPESPHTLPSIFDLAVCYEAAGKPHQALPLFHRAAVGVEKGKFQLREAGQIIDSLSRCHEQLKQFDQAEVWRQKWLAAVKNRAENKSAANAAELTEALERLVRLYEQWERPDEAAKWRTELERAKEKR
jgi:tetratricopeptide (TPR) repeat protein